jgi:hypothetical protein
MTIRPIALAGLVVLAGCAAAAPRAAAEPSAVVATRAAGTHIGRLAASNSQPSGSRRASSAPSSPPLSSGAAGADASDGEEGLSPEGEADPLVSNGLGSPSCKQALGEELSETSRRHCQTSGFIAAAAPTGNYGIDVHIDTGVLGLSSGGLLSTVQDLFVTPLWMALVWSVHALVVMLEWSFTIDLLDIATAGGLGSSLRTAEAVLTMPWLPMALAVASILVVYDGLIRRRVAETLGEALMMGVMMAGGLWLIVDPSGTVGALGRWANQASLGTLAVAARGTPATPGQALSQGMDTLFTQAIESPWCYLEFGDVNWCRNSARLDPRLHAAGLKIAAAESSSAGCRPAPASCAAGAGASPSKALERGAELLREAQSNGAIFLALPANGSARNSINEQDSLLRTLCQTSEATNCRGPTAAQAEFRTNGGTWSRFGGLLLIAAGLLGMLLLLGFIAVRLLGAALFSVLYLLLAPGMVIAPAFGQAGRAVFRRWISRLLGAVVSKLLFSFLLGAVLAVLAVLSDLQSLGWWTQWLLMSAFWWSAYTRRHQAIGAIDGVIAGHRSSERVMRRSVVRRVSDVIESRKGMAAARWATGRRSRPAPDVERHRPPRRADRSRSAERMAGVSADNQVKRALESEHRAASARVGSKQQSDRRLSAKHAQLGRLRREGAGAASAGDTRRAAEMSHRADRVASEIDREREALGKARRVVGDGEHALRRTGDVYTREGVAEHARFLDAQARLPSRAREHAALAGLAGYGREEYERLDPRRARAARLEIDRELALRRELTGGSRSAAQLQAEGQSGRVDRSGVEREPGGGSRQPGRHAEHGLPGSSTRRGVPGARRAAEHTERHPVSDRSSVLHDAREVAARRKRQLGRGRP